MTNDNTCHQQFVDGGADELGQQELQLAELTKRGATMEKVARLREPVARAPKEAVRALKLGNARYYGGQALRQEHSSVERRAQIVGQTPFAVVLDCSASRSSTSTGTPSCRRRWAWGRSRSSAHKTRSAAGP